MLYTIDFQADTSRPLIACCGALARSL